MIILKSEEEIGRIAVACRIVADVLRALQSKVKPGVTTKDLDRLAEEMILRRGALPAFKGYRNFPATLCASVNEQVVHGIPAQRPLKEGDVVGLDLGAIWEGYYGDGAVTVAVGPVSPEAQRLLKVTEEALYAGIEKCAEGNRLSDISHAIQQKAESAGFSVVTDFVGHGIGRSLHEEPQVPNFGEAGRGPRLKSGMVLAIEPMINAGGSEVRILEDQWTAVTCDGSLSAHFEHTVAVTPDGPRILTALDHSVSAATGSK